MTAKGLPAKSAFRVYGVNLVVRMLQEPPPQEMNLNCPRGSPIRYGTVVATGDGFDQGGNTFREMPPIQSVVAFEETDEGVEGHYFYMSSEEFRVLHLDAVILAFPR